MKHYLRVSLVTNMIMSLLCPLGLDIFFGDSCLTLWNDVLGPDSLWEEFQSDSSMFSDVSAALKLAQ